MVSDVTAVLRWPSALEHVLQVGGRATHRRPVGVMVQDTIPTPKTLFELGRPRPPAVEAVEVRTPDSLLEDLNVAHVKPPFVNHPRLDTQGATEDEPAEGEVPEGARVAHHDAGLPLDVTRRAATLAVQPRIAAEAARLLRGRLVLEIVAHLPEPRENLRVGLGRTTGTPKGTLDRIASNQLRRTPVGVEGRRTPREIAHGTVHSREQTDPILTGTLHDEVEPRHLLHPQDPLSPFLRRHLLDQGGIPPEPAHASDLTPSRLEILKNLRQHLPRGVVGRG